MKKNALKFVEVIVLLGKTTLPNLYLWEEKNEVFRKIRKYQFHKQLRIL